MRSKLTTKYALVAMVGIVVATLWALPASGASPLKLAKKALTKAKQANRTANEALTLAQTPGPPGPQGSPGTARAYALVNPACVGGPPEICPFERAKGISAVTRIATGVYCITAPGIDSASVPSAATVHWNNTAGDEGNTSALSATQAGCGAGVFAVRTERQPSTVVDGTPVSGNATEANNVGFTIVIP